MHIAVISDVHGNVAALDEVLRDAEQHEVSHYWLLGDLVAYGPRPVEVLERVRRLSHLRCVRGNTDRYVLAGDVGGMIPPIDHPRTPDEHRVLADARESFAWTRGCLVGSGQYSWLSGLPLEERITLPDGMRVLLVHASPGRDDGWGMHPDLSDDELAHLGFTGEVADLIFVGHTHVAGERRAAGSYIVNPGSVSLPRDPDDQARWALVSVTAQGFAIEFRSVAYNLREVVSDLDRQHHPSSGWLRAKMTGHK